jgi:sugar phosphate isomerase/epimerase
MPKFAVMTFMFKPWWQDGRTTHEAMLEGFAAAGAEGVEPFHRDFVDEPALVARYTKTLGDLGMHVAAVDVMCNLVYADAVQKQKDRDELRRGLDICVELGADIAHVAGHALRDGVTPEDGRKMIAEGMLEVAEFAQAHDLVLAIENFNPSPELVCSGAHCLEIMELTDGAVRFVLDTGNFLAVDERADEQFLLVADRICHCHFKDFAPDPEAANGHRSCDLGAGMIPNAAVACQLLERGYEGWVALETAPRSDVGPVEVVQRELPLLKSWFGA